MMALALSATMALSAMMAFLGNCFAIHSIGLVREDRLLWSPSRGAGLSCKLVCKLGCKLRRRLCRKWGRRLGGELACSGEGLLVKPLGRRL